MQVTGDPNPWRYLTLTEFTYFVLSSGIISALTNKSTIGLMILSASLFIFHQTSAIIRISTSIGNFVAGRRLLLSMGVLTSIQPLYFLLFIIFPFATGVYILFAEKGSWIVQDVLSIEILYRNKKWILKPLQIF